MNDYITIPLSKKRVTAKYAGQYEAIVSNEDAEYIKQFNWTISKTSGSYYAKRLIRENGKYKQIQMHRVILARKLERDELLPHEIVDHIDGNGLNNRRENLRLATHTQNMQNSKKPKNNTSGYKGVSYAKHTKRWVARLMANGKYHHIGYFDTAELANEACIKARIELHGEFANGGDKQSGNE